MDPAVYRALVEGAREAMAVVDPKTGRLIYANPRFLAQIGRDVNACIEAGKSALVAAYGLDAVKH